MALTVNEIKHAQPGPRDYKLTDSNGLFLLIRPAGGKSWRFKYRFGTRERTITLGRFPSMGLVAARDAHQQARQLLLEGKDPAIEKKKAKIKWIAASQATFRRTGEEWLIDISTSMNERAADLERDGDRMIIDMILVHVPPGVSASEWSYNRSRYRKRRAALLQVWADLISAGLKAPVQMLPR